MNGMNNAALKEEYGNEVAKNNFLLVLFCNSVRKKLKA